jgi:hypothetical protein
MIMVMMTTPPTHNQANGEGRRARPSRPFAPGRRGEGRGGGRVPLGPSSRDEAARGLGEGRGGAIAGTKSAG